MSAGSLFGKPTVVIEPGGSNLLPDPRALICTAEESSALVEQFTNGGLMPDRVYDPRKWTISKLGNNWWAEEPEVNIKGPCTCATLTSWEAAMSYVNHRLRLDGAIWQNVM